MGKIIFLPSRVVGSQYRNADNIHMKWVFATSAVVCLTIVILTFMTREAVERAPDQRPVQAVEKATSSNESQENGGLLSKLRELLGDIEGLKIRATGGAVVLEGDILLPKDLIRIIRVADALKDERVTKSFPIHNETRLSPTTLKIIAERIEREINSPRLTASPLNGDIFLKGIAENEGEAERAVQIATTYLPESLVDKSKDLAHKFRLNGAGKKGLPAIVDLIYVRPALSFAKRSTGPRSWDSGLTGLFYP